MIYWPPEHKPADPLCEARVRAAFEQPTASVDVLQDWLAAGCFQVLVADGVHDAACAEANGQTWSIYYALDHMSAHPNCTRSFTPAGADNLIRLANAATRAVEKECYG